MPDIRQLKKPNKARITLSDDSVILLSTDLIAEVSQDMGDILNVHNICGIHPIFGPDYCPRCKEEGNLEGCGKWFIVFSRRGESGPVTIQLKDGGTLYPKAFELVEDDESLWLKPDGPKTEMRLA